MYNLSKEAKTIRVSNAVAASQTTLSTSIVDLGGSAGAGGYDAVMFVVLLNTMTAGSVLTATVQDNSTNAAGGMANVTASYAAVSQTNAANATVAQSASNAGVVFTDVGGLSSNEVFLVDCALPQKEFVRLQITIATANAAFDGVLAILYRSKNRPTVVDTSVGGVGYFVASS